MNSSGEIAIRRQLRKFVSGEIPLKEFAAWLAPRIRGLEGAMATEDVVYEIQLRIAEFSNGDWTETELRELLRPLVTTYRISIHSPVIGLTYGSSTTDISPSHPLLFELVAR